MDNDELRNLMDQANIVSYFGGNPESILLKIGRKVEEMERFECLRVKMMDDAVGFAKVLCRLGFSTLIVPQVDRFRVFWRKHVDR